MTTNMERWGTELAMLLRREAECRAVQLELRDKIEDVCKRITTEPTGTLYGAGTGEQPVIGEVGPDRIDPVQWANGTSPEQTMPGKARNQVPVPMPRPYRPDHQDGGNTFRLTPLADATEVATVTLPAVVPCPTVLARERGSQERPCQERVPHIHTADGAVKRVAEL